MITICVVIVKLWFDTFDAYVTTKNSEEGYGVLLQQVSIDISANSLKEFET